MLCNLADEKQEFFTKEEAMRQHLEIATEFPEEFTEQYTKFDMEADGPLFSRIKARWDRMHPHKCRPLHGIHKNGGGAYD